MQEKDVIKAISFILFFYIISCILVYKTEKKNIYQYNLIYYTLPLNMNMIIQLKNEKMKI